MSAPERTPRRNPLPLRAEIRRQLSRRRTHIAFGIVMVVPLLLVGAFALAGDDDGGTGFVDLATQGALNFTLFAMFATNGFVLVVLAALFTGDTVAAEASWGSLRYLLTAPVRRSRLLRQKLVVGYGSFILAMATLIAVSLLLGTISYGWSDLLTPLGLSLPADEALGRLLLAAGYIVVQLASVAAIAFYLGTRTQAPLGAVGGSVLVVLISAILDTITALGDWRVVLPTHDQFAWTALLAEAPDWDEVLRGAGVALSYAAVLLAAAWRHFLRADVLS